MHSRPPSIRDIARACGYGKSSVAAALANSPEIPAGTIATIRAAAERLGYRRDPIVSDLAARRWRTRRNATPPLLAYVYDYGEERVSGGPPMAEVCAAAVGLLVGQLHINARGIPSPLQTVLNGSLWHEGATLSHPQDASPPGEGGFKG